MKITVKKTHGGLRPMYDSDFENYAKIQIGEEFEIDYTKKRNLKFHKKYFALLKLAFENQQDYRDMESMRRDIIITAGFYDEIVNKVTGEVYTLANSISFSKMDDLEFSDLYEKTKNVISKWIGIENESIENEIMQYY